MNKREISKELSQEFMHEIGRRFPTLRSSSNAYQILAIRRARGSATLSYNRKLEGRGEPKASVVGGRKVIPQPFYIFARRRTVF